MFGHSSSAVGTPALALGATDGLKRETVDQMTANPAAAINSDEPGRLAAVRNRTYARYARPRELVEAEINRTMFAAATTNPPTVTRQKGRASSRHRQSRTKGRVYNRNDQDTGQEP